MVSRTSIIAAIATVTSLVAVGGAVWVVRLIGRGNLRQAGFIGPAVTAFATISLVLITVLYVIYTKEIAEETERARIQENQPYFAIGFSDNSRRDEVGPTVLRNIGNGPATEIDLELSIDDTQHSIGGATLSAGESMQIECEDFQELSNPSAEIYEDSDQIEISGRYQDIFGNDQSVCQSHRIENIGATARASS